VLFKIASDMYVCYTGRNLQACATDSQPVWLPVSTFSCCVFLASHSFHFSRQCFRSLC